jgi:hypothetical protein
MRLRVESLVLLSASVVVAVAASCGPREPFRPGATDVPRPASSIRAEPQPSSLPKWERFEELGKLQPIAASFGSRGHGTGEWLAQVRASAPAASAMPKLVPGASMPQGSLLVQLHTDKRTGAASDGLFMEKREAGYFPAGGDWDWGVIGSDGLVQHRGKLEFCARCHAEAAVDYVFPVAEK